MDDGDASDMGGADQVHVNIKANVVHRQQQLQPWQTGLFDCGHDNCEAFCWSACIPCLPFACIADIVDQGENCACCHCLFYLLAANFGVWCLYAGWNRGKLRARYGLQEAPLPDWITHLFFHWCALAQEYRELAKLGFKVLDGWEGRPRPAPAPAQPQGAPPVQKPMNRAAPPPA